jgi:hypothetical protein
MKRRLAMMTNDYKVLLEKLVDEISDIDEKEKQIIKELVLKVLDLERQYEFSEDRPRIKNALDDIL